MPQAVAVEIDGYAAKFLDVSDEQPAAVHSPMVRTAGRVGHITLCLKNLRQRRTNIAARLVSHISPMQGARQSLNPDALV